MIHHRATIHHKACVDASNVTIGAGTVVYQFATVIQGTVLGEDCRVGACATISGAVFGDRCKISSGVVMGAGFLIGDDVFIGPNVVLCNDKWPEFSEEGWDVEAIRNGRYCVIIGSGAAIGANATILPGVTIGEGAMVGAGVAVRRNVPAWHLVKPDNSIEKIPADRRLLRMEYAT